MFLFFSFQNSSLRNSVNNIHSGYISTNPLVLWVFTPNSSTGCTINLIHVSLKHYIQVDSVNMSVALLASEGRTSLVNAIVISSCPHQLLEININQGSNWHWLDRHTVSQTTTLIGYSLSFILCTDFTRKHLSDVFKFPLNVEYNVNESWKLNVIIRRPITLFQKVLVER